MWRFGPNTVPQGHSKVIINVPTQRYAHFECLGLLSHRLVDNLPFGE